MAVTPDILELQASCGLTDADVDALALWKTGDQGCFPGALLPIRGPDGLTIYAVAQTAAEWRKLQPLLTAFAGPTLTDFEGAPQRLDSSQPLEAKLIDSGVHAAARLRPGSFPRAEVLVVTALRRLQTRLQEAPDLSRTRPEPTSGLLARLQDALNGGDFEEAWRLLAVLRLELRLDAMNLAQLEMQILAGAGRWSDIRWHERFESLVQGGPGAATSEILLCALYNAHLAQLDPSDGAALAMAWHDVVAIHAEPLLRVVPHATGPAIALMRSLSADGRELPSAGRVEPCAEPLIGPDRARQALLALALAPESGNFELDSETRAAVLALNESQRQELLARPMFRALWAELSERVGTGSSPSGWVDWVCRLGDSGFDAIGYAARAPTEWGLPDADVDPAEAGKLAGAIRAVPEGLAGERLSVALPYFVQWSRRDPRWPRGAYRPVYLALLERMALGSHRGEPVLKSAVTLLEGALRTGLSLMEYRDALDAGWAIASGGLCRATAYEALDLLDVASGVTPVDDTTFRTFAFGILSDLAAIRARLTPAQRALAGRLGAPLGWVQPDEVDLAPDTRLSERLSRRSIAIYTLTESAGRQAREILEAAAPGLRISLNHDHVGSAPLAALAKNVDLFVLVAGSATHAATDFIRSHRGDAPLVYAAGKGAASILRVVEHWAAAATE